MVWQNYQSRTTTAGSNSRNKNVGKSCSSKSLDMNSVLRGEIIPLPAGDDSSSRGDFASKMFVPLAVTRGIRNLAFLGNIELQERCGISKNGSDEVENLNLAKTSVLKQAAQSRRNLHDAIQQMDTKDWQDFQKTLRKTDTCTNGGLSMALNCHFVDALMEGTSGTLISLDPELITGHQKKAHQVVVDRRWSSPPSLESRYHLVKKTSLRQIMEQQTNESSQQEELHAHRNIAKNLGLVVKRSLSLRAFTSPLSDSTEHADSDEPGMSNTESTNRGLAMRGLQKSSCRSIDPKYTVIVEEESSPNSEWKVVERSRRSSLSGMFKRRSSVSSLLVNDNKGCDSKEPCLVQLQKASNEAGEKETKTSNNYENASSNDNDVDLEEEEIFFPSREERLKARNERRRASVNALL